MEQVNSLVYETMSYQIAMYSEGRCYQCPTTGHANPAGCLRLLLEIIPRPLALVYEVLDPHRRRLSPTPVPIFVFLAVARMYIARSEARC